MYHLINFFFTKVTLLGRGFGADVVLALTTAPRAKGLFQQVWATNGAGAFANNTLDQVNSENKVRRGSTSFKTKRIRHHIFPQIERHWYC